MIQHFVITWFSMETEARGAHMRNLPGWLDRRFDMFETFCLPSMASQTCKAFHWLVYFDEATPAPFYDRITRAKHWIDFEARFEDPFSHSLVARDVAERTGATADIVLTTRIDCDYALARDFIMWVQDEALRAPANSMLSFRNGFSLHDGKVYSATGSKRAVATLVESKRHSGEKIWAPRRDASAAECTVHKVHGSPAWIHVIHGESRSNLINGARVGDYRALSGFSFDQSVFIKPVSHLVLLCDLLVCLPLRVARDAFLTFADRLSGSR